MPHETLKQNSPEQNENSRMDQLLELVGELLAEDMSKEEILSALTDAFDESVAKTIVNMLSEEHFKKANTNPTEMFKDSSETFEKNEGPLTTEDIPTYMYGYRGMGFVFEEQTDKQARTMAQYAGMRNMKTNGDNRDHFGQDAYPDREYISKGGRTSDAEIITKEQIKESEEKRMGKKPIFWKDKKREWRASFEKDKEELYDVLNLYLLALQPRGPSTIVIGIKILEGITPAPFKDKLAEEVFEADKKIGVLFIGSDSLVENMGGHKEYLRRIDELKKIAQELFLKYANEQLRKKKTI